jgi:hypothetical protein
MAFGSATFTDLGGAASDIFSGITGSESLKIKAQGDLAAAGVSWSRVPSDQT